MNNKPPASISLDLDNQWSYMKTHGDSGWESFPSYLDVFVPHALEMLAALDLKITFFVVGQDAALDQNRDALGLITKYGHDIGNHSYHHEQWMQEYSRARIRTELTQASNAICEATGYQPRGFRGPGFAWSENMMEALVDEGFLYDASTLPTYLGPLARLYYFRQASLSKAEKEQRKDLFGGFSAGLRPVKPYNWLLDSEPDRKRTLLEIPVTTTPFLKTPFHLSYLLYLSRFSRTLMSAYLKTVLGLCRMTGTTPSFLLHPLDLIGSEQLPQLKFFPGMDLSSEHKAGVFNQVLGELGKYYNLVSMTEHAEHLLKQDIPVRTVNNRRMSEVVQ